LRGSWVRLALEAYFKNSILIKLPKKTLAIVIKWANINQKKLLTNWVKLCKTGKYSKIKPPNLL